ncbi:MAG: hypothetical protein KDB58_04465 [Solirubrobacterales bacterium]|nr:hypothetical protein [Solirubrobacterales bacterium]MCB8969531.1 hypothetical protein [Thermoleophilales bacterium]MCO5326588.1 hypothetical protein [Solirubrobacterales bacterium]
MSRRAAPATAIAAAALGFLGAGCGGSSGPEPPERCIAEWNADEIAKTLGKHAYDGHEIRSAKVEEIEAPPGAENIRSERTCLVVFAVAEGDKEEGRLGLVVTRFGWSQLFELGYSDAKLLELQRSAHGGTNAELFPDGSLE